MKRLNERTGRVRSGRIVQANRLQRGQHEGAREEAIAKDLDRISKISLAELREAWEERFGSPPPKMRTRDILLRLLCWRIQAEAFGGLDPATARKLRQLGAAFSKDPNHRPASSAEVPQGTILVREWKGVVHRVLVQKGGFIYQERHFKSLSDVARTITGTNWSGPRFFGLEMRSDRKPKGRAL